MFIYFLCGFSLAYANTISIVLKNAPTSLIFTYLAEETGKNMVLDDNIETKSTLRLENKSVDEIFKTLGKVNKLSLTQEDDIVYIHKKEEKAADLTPLPIMNLQNNGQNTPLVTAPKLITKTLKLHYAKASEVIESLTKGSGTFLSENGYIHFDERSNSLIVKDSAKSLKNIENLVKQLDQPTEQIAIEARIVTISSEHLQELGVRWGIFSRGAGHYKFGGRLEGNGLNNVTNNLNVNFPITGGASAVLQVSSINSRVLDLELSALEQENSVEIIASPRLLTTNKKPASIKQGTEIPYVMYNTKSEATDVEFKEAVLGLEVVPHLSTQNQILLDLIVTQNSPNSQSGSSGLITIDKQELNTQVFAKHGETIVLGGIFQHLTQKGEDKVPILGSIPFIKRLFSQTRDKISKRELVIFVTPYILQSNEKSSNRKKSK
ncbi:TPA: type IV pilus secretin PilQ [Mannheimia haemolytica]|nr:type IV pilus secretin PilQ [Mannheimia haemolytica]HDL5228396.1 type IV pilus secretin PilQ [Mannheimia haemolytica]HDL5287343.1 type IV pilus secretin PilQ [Mannheimia haemolytica]HDL5374331.1 type IV pilus secretin PilQ [Mannheimia haemolytica]HDL5661595.1 type IV pilus secretin PilQ [Mannheimia haemolytica]